MLFYGGATYVNAGYMREQVCKYMCPYARFQSAMFDRDTLIITYDEQRGEPRGARKKGVDPKAQGLGDCVDCTMCVQVCPTGIDIRKGLQYECIACAACIDACDEVMDKVGYPRGLIRYDTQSGLEGKPSASLRPRTIVYAHPARAARGRLRLLDHAPHPRRRGRAARPERPLPRAARRPIENVYNVKILNKDGKAHEFTHHRQRPARAPWSTTPGRPCGSARAQVQGVPVRIRVPRRTRSQGGADIEVCDPGDRPAGPPSQRQGALPRAHATDTLRP